MKKIMIVGAGIEHMIAIRQAKEMGYKTFVIDGNPQAPGFAIADEHAVVSTYDYLNAFKQGHGRGVNGVMTVASDVPYTVAMVSKLLGLRGISPRTAWILSNKLNMKQVLKRNNVPVPDFMEINAVDDIERFMAVYSEAVVKPVDSRGARGVQKIFVGMDYGKALYVAEKNSPTGKAMIEQYIEGPQLSVEGFMVAGYLQLPAIFDRNYEHLHRFHPYIVENGGEMPSKYDYEEIRIVTQNAALTVGLTTGPIKGDLVLEPNRIKTLNPIVKVIEIAGRMSGGWFGTVAVPYATGVNLVKNNIKWVMEGNMERADWLRTENRGAAIRFAFPDEGKVLSVKGYSEVTKDPSCLYAGMFTKRGGQVSAIENHPARPAVVVAGGKDREEAKANAERLIGMIKIKT
jgi:biotin carboxylase